MEGEGIRLKIEEWWFGKGVVQKIFNYERLISSFVNESMALMRLRVTHNNLYFIVVLKKCKYVFGQIRSVCYERIRVYIFYASLAFILGWCHEPLYFA